MRGSALESRPLCVDLDGTLLRTDLLWESFLRLLRQRPVTALLALLQLLRGRSRLKAFIGMRVQLAGCCIPFNENFLAWLKTEKANGRRLVLATASDAALAKQILPEGLFTEVIGSDAGQNLKGRNKLEVLRQKFPDGYDYAGNSTADRPIWNAAHSSILVNAPQRIEEELARSGKLEAIFPAECTGRGLWLRALRLHQWSKNALVFVPAITSHSIFRPVILWPLAVLFLSLSLAASSLYIVNDLLDLDADRKHPRKSQRPFASARLPIIGGLLAAPLLLTLALGVALLLSWRTMFVVAAYAALSFAYSLVLKRIAPLDMFALAALYIFRIAAGGVTVGIHLTSWLILFSLFFFLSLACCKRVAELVLLRRAGVRQASGRGYGDIDLEQMNTFGVAATYTSSVIFALYLNSAQVRLLYAYPVWLWLLVPLVLYWQTRVWMLTWRAEMQDDPVAFALRDRFSYALGLITSLVILAAKFIPAPIW